MVPYKTSFRVFLIPPTFAMVLFEFSIKDQIILLQYFCCSSCSSFTDQARGAKKMSIEENGSEMITGRR